jgi:hypothetical protein
MIVMFTTYFFGCWWLPVVLVLIDIDLVKLGKAVPKRTIIASQSREGDKFVDGVDNYHSYDNFNENLSINHGDKYNEVENDNMIGTNLEESAIDARNSTKQPLQGRETIDDSEDDDSHIR